MHHNRKEEYNCIKNYSIITYATKSSFDVKRRNQGRCSFGGFDGTFCICLCGSRTGFSGNFTRGSNLKRKSPARLGCKSDGIYEYGSNVYWLQRREIFPGSADCRGSGRHGHWPEKCVCFVFLKDVLPADCRFWGKIS